MPYLGSTPNASFSSRTKQDFTANGSTTAFTLSSAVASANDIEVFVGNVRQEPTDAYTVNGTTLTMSEAPATGLNFYVVFKQLEENSVVPADGTISSAKIASNAVTMDKLPSALSFTGKTISNMTLPVETDIETLVVNVKSGTSTSIAVSTWTHVAGFNTEIIDNRNAWDGAGTFTVPAGMGGVYMAAFTSEFWFNSAGNDPTSIAQMWYVNGAQSNNYNRAYYNGSGNTAIGGFSPLLLGIHNLSAGDTLKPYCWQQNSGNNGASIENGMQTQVYIQRISGNT